MKVILVILLSFTMLLGTLPLSQFAFAGSLNVPSSFNFGNQHIGTSNQLSISVKNNGPPHSIVSITISGISANSFSFVMEPTCAPLPHFMNTNESCQILTTFSPTSFGQKSATLTIFTDNVFDPSYTIQLSGNGVGDFDSDGFLSPQDCNDSDASIFPGAVEVIDGKDNDCDGQIDDDLLVSCGVGTIQQDNQCIPDPNLQLICGDGTILDSSNNECIMDPAITDALNQLITQLQQQVQDLNVQISLLLSQLENSNPQYCGIPQNSWPVVIRGTEGNDNLVGTQFDDLIFGYGGNDKLTGKKGNDCLIGGAGNDNIQGNQGNDILLGGDGDDNIHGGQGDDTINGEGGSDRCHGGQGTNELQCEITRPMQEDPEDE